MLTPQRPPQLEIAALSDTGNKRENNEDAFLSLPEDRVFIVCDGMGGHLDGAEAAQVGIRVLSETALKAQPPVLTDRITQLLAGTRYSCGGP